METGIYPPLCIFPEGGNSNGSHLLRFKRGAFTSLLPITPLVIEFQYEMFSPAFDVIGFFPYLIFQLSSIQTSCILKKFPVFVPNEYLFKNHANKGSDKWEIYSWALRDVMSIGGSITKSDDQSQADRLHYKALMGVKSDKYKKI